LEQEEYFYSGEEVGRLDEEYSEFTSAEEVQTEELCREEEKTSAVVPTVKVSIITPPIVLASLSK
jgi:hypothetical protein